MSGAEHLDIASAHLKGINESVSCANVHIEPSGEDKLINSENDQSVPSVHFVSSGERGPVCYANSVVSTVNEDCGSTTDWDVVKCLGDGLNTIQTVGEGPGILENKARACEPDGMGNRMSSCSTVRNIGTLGKSLSPGETVGEQPHTEDGEDSYGSAEHSNGASTCKKDEILGEGLSPLKSKCTCVAVEDGTKQSRESMSHTPCHRAHTCDLSRLENPIGLVSLKSELSDVNVDKENSVVVELVADSLIPIENTVGLHGKPDVQNDSANFGIESSSFAQPNSTATKRTVEHSFENNYGTGPVDDLLNKSMLTSNMVVECDSPEIVAKTFKEGNLGNHNNEQSEEKAKPGSETAPDITKVEQTAESKIGIVESFPTDGAQRFPVEEVENCLHGMSESSCGIGKKKSAASDVKDCPNEQAESLSEEITGKLHVVVFGCPANGEISKRGRRRGKFSVVSMAKKDPQISSVGSARVLRRPRSQGNPEDPEPSSNVENKTSSTGKRRGRRKKTEIEGTSLERISSITGKRRGRRKKTEIEGKPHDQFSRMRTHLRYLLHRIRYEQNLLDAYSNEGWRGQSLEKLRPEKELQRAKADINRSKLKIRNLFQHLDSMSTEGRFPDSLFDSEGLIDSEDIFCAKCGSKELSVDNDIILCDGTCDRGFHQFCLEPPLRTEEIPPGDEGWLCPACDCKADCIDLLNDSQLTKLSIEDRWEKVFPEAVASLVGNEHDDLMGLPSDDSEDNDYNPDGTDDPKVEGSGSSSDGSDSAESDSSDFSSASEDLGAIGVDNQYLGLPSDDSEDDDYDPDTANNNEDVQQESSSSDFTSASEDLGAGVHNDGNFGDDEAPVSLLDPDEDTSGSPLLSGRRHLERLDYKKLYDETYGNAPSDSSDDEEWTDNISACNTKSSTEKGVLDSSIGNASASADGCCSAGAPQKRGRKKLNLQATNGSPAQPVKSSGKTSNGQRMRKPHNRLGEAVTRRLYESFKENQYPDRMVKERLAKELGLSPKRVDKWFGNARWSFNHHPERLEASMAAASLGTPPNVAFNGVESTSGDIKESAKAKSTPKTSRKRKNMEDYQPVPQGLNIETSRGGAQTDSLQNPEVVTDTMQAPVVQHGSGQKRRKSSA